MILCTVTSKVSDERSDDKTSKSCVLCNRPKNLSTKVKIFVHATKLEVYIFCQNNYF